MVRIGVVKADERLLQRKVSIQTFQDSTLHKNAHASRKSTKSRIKAPDSVYLAPVKC